MATNELLQVKPTDEVPQLCARLGAYLGLDEAVSEAILLRALAEPSFAKKLLAARHQMNLLYPLLQSAVNKRMAETPSNLALIRKASTAFLKWGKAGFTMVDQETLEKREAACLSCPHLGMSVRLVQKLMAKKRIVGVPGKRLGGSVCRQCNCVMARKIKLTSARCPDKHPSLKGLSRWEEPTKRVR